MWIERQVRVQPQIPREIGLVDRSLWKCFGDLANGRTKWPLLLYGAPGTGKTSAAYCLCDRAATAAYATVDRLCNRVMANDDHDLWSWIGTRHLAVLDELAARRSVGDLHYSVVKAFADAREHQPTVYITNVDPHTLRDLYDERIFSRVACGTWFEAKGEDRRFQS